MPYIKPEQRALLDQGNFPQNAGELNYCLTRWLQRYLEMKGKNYQSLNEIMGVLECVSQEFYRRAVAPYEDEKIRENGDIF